jgi:hypothetical protein
MSALRYQHGSFSLNDGRVLVVGGYSISEGPLKSAELYDPAGTVSDGGASVGSVIPLPNGTLRMYYGGLHSRGVPLN